MFCSPREINELFFLPKVCNKEKFVLREVICLIYAEALDGHVADSADPERSALHTVDARNEAICHCEDGVRVTDLSFTSTSRQSESD